MSKEAHFKKSIWFNGEWVDDVIFAIRKVEKRVNMRREEKKIQDPDIIFSIMQEATVCRIALSEDNMPYIIPMNFAFDNEYIYLHSAKQGKKIDILKKNQNVCFEIENQVEIIEADKACNWSMRFSSVIGFGQAYFIDDIEEKRKVFDSIMKKYSPNNIFDYALSQLNGVEVIKIKINNMSGKKSG